MFKLTNRAGLAGETVVAMIEEDCGSNDIKFRKFCQLVNSAGYQLTEAQVNSREAVGVAVGAPVT